ncbi:CAP domain-containing protein [Flavobacterium sp.]|uniref:CAP domain-containing protein n=1 Tax=Flavobacterium sp. TaxID=239 RepID=UPI002627E0A4|nr:CAP domain-containing protein [Flavobacterium sp.]
MRITLSKIVFLVLVSMSIVSCSSEDAVTAPVDNTQATAQYQYENEETQVMTLVNNYRQNLGLNTLQKIDFISIKSEEHNEYMISTGEINHNYFQDRAQSLMEVLGAVNVSENLAYNYSTPESVFNAWLNSASHKANIVGDFSHFGISIRKDANGKKYYTNMFIKK